LQELFKYRDFVVIGAGIYGLYAANLLCQKNFTITLLEFDDRPFSRASYINQARVHNGYHYPRSLSTAITSAQYFRRFIEDYSTAINKSFKQIYAISNRNSYTSSKQFMKFCYTCNIPISEVDPNIYFNPGTVEGAFETEEFAFDGKMLMNILVERNKQYSKLEVLFSRHIVSAEKDNEFYYLILSDGIKIKTRGVINATYASINQVLQLFDFELYTIKYEIAEIILAEAHGKLDNLGITVMDGPFFSVMPFGNQNIHTLTSVEFTPHKTSNNILPEFDCQSNNNSCTPLILQNCNQCMAKPKTSRVYMFQLAKKYLKPEYKLNYSKSLFAIKPILKASEIDDSRPTAIRKYSDSPIFISVLSGKINTIYEMEGFINEL